MHENTKNEDCPIAPSPPMKTDRPIFAITIRSERPDAGADHRQLRETLKRLLRGLGWRCVRCEQVAPNADHPTTTKAN